MSAKRPFLIGAIVCATLSVVSAAIWFICHSTIGPIAAGPPVPVLLYSGNPFFEQLYLASCIVFGLVSLTLVVFSRKKHET